MHRSRVCNKINPNILAISLLPYAPSHFTACTTTQFAARRCNRKVPGLLIYWWKTKTQFVKGTRSWSCTAQLPAAALLRAGWQIQAEYSDWLKGSFRNKMLCKWRILGSWAWTLSMSEVTSAHLRAWLTPHKQAEKVPGTDLSQAPLSHPYGSAPLVASPQASWLSWLS